MIAVSCISVFAASAWLGRRHVYRTVGDSERLLDAAGVAPGIPAARLLAILDSLGVDHSEMGADRVVGARLGRSFEDLVIHGDINATFRFDSTGRLASRTVREVLMGP